MKHAFPLLFAAFAGNLLFAQQQPGTQPTPAESSRQPKAGNNSSNSNAAQQGNREGPGTGRGTSSSASAQSGSVSDSDRKFMLDAAESGHSEIALAQLAINKASNAKVKGTPACCPPITAKQTTNYSASLRRTTSF